MVLAENMIYVFIAILTNSDESVVNEWLNPTVFENALYPGVPTGRMGRGSAALRGDLGLYQFPGRAVALAIESGTYVRNFVLINHQKRFSNERRVHTLQEGEGGGPRIEGIGKG